MARKGRGAKSFGILGALGAAAAAWYFLDPKRGKERREKVATKSKELYEKGSEEAKRLSGEAQKGISSAVDRTSDIARQGLDAISSASHNVTEGAQRLKDRTVEKINAAKGSAANRIAEEAEAVASSSSKNSSGKSKSKSASK